MKYNVIYSRAGLTEIKTIKDRERGTKKQISLKMEFHVKWVRIARKAQPRAGRHLQAWIHK
jgi:hypothetical protein